MIPVSAGRQKSICRRIHSKHTWKTHVDPPMKPCDPWVNAAGILAGSADESSPPEYVMMARGSAIKAARRNADPDTAAIFVRRTRRRDPSLQHVACSLGAWPRGPFRLQSLRFQALVDRGSVATRRGPLRTTGHRMRDHGMPLRYATGGVPHGGKTSGVPDPGGES